MDTNSHHAHMLTQVPFRQWVPNWLQVLVALIILVPTLMINGAYNGNSIDISSFFGVLSEDINFAFYAASIGMAVAYTTTRRIKLIATPKTIILTSLITQVILSFFCARAEHIETIAFLSFFIGFMKAFTLREVMIILMPIFGGRATKLSRFYALYYPITVGLSQIVMAFTAELAYTFKWQYMYYFMIALLLFAIGTVLICLRYARRPLRIPYKEINWLDMAAAAAFLISLVYILIYGKVKDWFDSEQIWVGLLIGIPALIFFARRQLLSKDPYVDFSILKYRDTLTSYICLFAILIFAQTSTLVSSYTNSVLKLDSIHANIIYLWIVPGLILAAPLCYWWYEKGYPLRWLALLSFFCIIASNGILYFQVYTQGTYQDIYPSMILKGFAMLIAYVIFGVRASSPLPSNKKLSNAFFMIGIRSIIIPVVGTAIFSNWLYVLQVRNTMVLSEGFNIQNPLFSDRYNQSLHSALTQGMSAQDAQSTALSSLYGSLQTQSTLVSIKTILGYCLIVGIILMSLMFIASLRSKSNPQNAGLGTDMV